MRILHVNDEGLEELGGVSSYLERLLPAQRALGHETRLLAGFIRHEGWRRALDVWDPAARRVVEREIDDWQPDVLHLHSVLRECSVAVVAVRRPLPVVLSVHDHKLLGRTVHGGVGVTDLLDRWVKSPFERAVARRRVSLFAPVSQELSELCTQARLGPSSWLPGPTLLPVQAPPPPSGCRDVVFVGRMSADKGVAQLLQAWELLDDRFPDSRLHLLGDGPELPASTRSSVVLHGAVDPAAVSRALADARVFVAPYQPSLRQASSLTTLEAAAHGRPVVVGNDPAVVEILDRLGAGTAVDATQPQRIADAIARLLEDGAAADAEGAVLAAAVGQWYSPEAVARRSLEIYAEAGAVSPGP